ncbi:hypothetical protein BJ322DRAFT_1105967 [Thelephora terrestris]|uniref:Uncharacterized protein n=1 Tax=Thelephora terrestris TaxID=56493 RepID=A0A9P6HJZ4_9AGAM|nr:hypothetical protein BJ322DRAFT_1105967 [Thelephora terrestris]
MATSYVGQVSAFSKHHGSARKSYGDISKPTLGIDLRFEQTYLKSIAPHVRLTTPVPDEDEKRGDVVPLQGQQLDIKWGTVIWITTKDHILAPLFQGMIWGILSPWVRYFRTGLTMGRRSSSRTGAGIAKLKSWLSSLVPQTTTASFRAK